MVVSVEEIEALVVELRPRLVDRDAVIAAQAELLVGLRSEVADLVAEVGEGFGEFVCASGSA